MSKALAKATLNLVIAEVSKDLSDPSMGSYNDYWQVLSEGIENYIRKIASCKHENTISYIHTCGLTDSGKKIICQTTYCEDCGSTIKSEPYGKVESNDKL